MTSALRFAQERLDAAEHEASRCARYLGDLVEKGEEESDTFGDVVEQLDNAQRAAARWRAVRDAASISRPMMSSGSAMLRSDEPPLGAF